MSRHFKSNVAQARLSQLSLALLLVMIALVVPAAPLAGAAQAIPAERYSLQGDTIPPAAPSNVAAIAGNGRVSLSWNANTEPDLAGYNVYRSTTQPVATTGAPLNGATLLTTTSFLDTGLTNDTTYHYVVQAVDTSSNKAAADPVSATPQASAATIDIKVNFQSETAPVPAGYTRDYGQPYGDRTGVNQGVGLSYGWVVPGSNTPLNLVGNGRDRELNADQRLDTFMHMQFSGTSGGIASPGAWEVAVPNDAYVVKVSVGDAGAYYNSVHQISVEGQVAIAGYAPTATSRFANTTRTVNVTDGRLTIDAQGGANTKINYVTILTAADATRRPTVTGTTPGDGATGVVRNTAIAATVRLPNVGYGVDESTLTAATVKLVRTTDDTEAPANRNTSGGGDVIVLQPTVLLDANTSYRFEVSEGVKDLSGAAFLPYSMTFTTGSGDGSGGAFNGQFEKVPLPTATGKSFSSLTMGPDGKLYASTIEGEILRWSLNADGTLGAAQVITSLQTAEGGPRMLIGLVFDPRSTATNLTLWTSHSFLAQNNGPDWAGKITRLSGPNLETVQDYVVGLPRSIRDHLTNSVVFGPDGALYVNQGSNSAMGAPDAAWGNRPERLLSAAVLRIDTAAITTPPLNVQTEGRTDGPNYNPFATGAPLTIYATGVRNAYDLVWHSNGQLYVPANGSAAGGNTPGTPATLPASCQNRIDKAANGDYTGPQAPGITNVTVTQYDYLFRVVRNGYYGHPNPTRCEWILNGGDPTGGSDPAQVVQYPDGTQPDRNWRGAAFDFLNNKSPNGVIEYKNTSAFGGTLKGRLLVVRYSAGDDIIVLTPGGANLDIASSQTSVPGLTGFIDPLDLVENVANGNLYVSEFGAQKLTLLRPTAGGAATQINWSSVAAAPTQLSEAQGVAVDGKLYVFSGYPPPCCTPTPRVDVYDPVTNAWTRLADMPVGATHVGLAVDGRNIYLAGGWPALPGGGRTTGSKKVWKYNIDTNTYTPMPDLPVERGAGQLALVGRNLHYFGGLSLNLQNVGDHYVLSLDGGAAWATRAPLPNPRNHLGGAVLNGQIYAIGGQLGEHSTLVTQSSVHRYDPASNTWAEMAPLPRARGHIASSTFVLNGRIIVAGGETAHQAGIADVTAYDPAANTWTAMTPLPATRISGVAAQIGGNIYFATGSYTTTTYKGVLATSGAAIGSWTPKAPMPASILDAGGAALGGKLYAVGGKTSAGPQRTMYVYNPATNGWVTGPPLPTAYPAVENPAVAAYNGKLYVFGGSSGPFSGAVTSAAVFDPATNAWAMLAPAQTARGGATVQAVGTKIYVAGGMDGTGASLASVEAYDPATNTWRAVASMGTRRDNPGSAVLGGKLYVFGGRIRNADGTSPNATLNTVEVYDAATNVWTAKASMPTGRRAMVVGALGGRAQVIGGERTSAGGTFGQNEEYDPVANTWRALTPMPTPRHGAVSGTINGVVYVVAGGPQGGSSYSNVNEAFSLPATDTTAPTVSSVTPTANATGVVLTTNATAVFSEAMDAASLTTSTFTLVKQGTTTPVAAAVTYDSTAKRATLNPSTDLAAGATYTATVKGGTSGVRDVAGNRLAADKTWSFTTATSTTPAGGLKGEYHDNQDLTNLKLTRTDPVVNFSWGSGSPDPVIAPDSFSVRWTGWVKADRSETYTFYTTSNDGVRLSVNGQLLINNWTNHTATENRGAITLTAGQWYPVKLEYYEGTGNSIISLSYSSASTPKQIIPSDHLSASSP